MPHRFYCPQLAESGSVSLTEAEAHHLTHVLRHEPGDVVELFNGSGLVAACRVATVRKREVELDILSIRQDQHEQQNLTIATAVPKGDRIEWLIEKATELGVTRLVPLITLHSVVDPRTSKLEKLRQTVITACKQSGRNHLMAISAVTRWNEFLREFAPTHRILIAHPHGSEISTAIVASLSNLQPVVIAIGPEGGFSDEEIQSVIDVGGQAVRLGPHILRIETAAIAMAARILLD